MVIPPYFSGSKISLGGHNGYDILRKAKSSLFCGIVSLRIVKLIKRLRSYIGGFRNRVGEIIRDLCRQRGVELLEGHLMTDHIHMCLPWCIHSKIIRKYCFPKSSLSSSPQVPLIGLLQPPRHRSGSCASHLFLRCGFPQ